MFYGFDRDHGRLLGRGMAVIMGASVITSAPLPCAFAC